MKQILFPLCVALILAACTNNAKKVTDVTEPTPKTVSKPSPKEMLLANLDPTTRGFVRVVDSLNPINPTLKRDFYDRNVHIDKGTEKEWREIQPETSSWVENEYDEETGVLTKSTTNKRHVGNAYLLSVQKDDRWTNQMGGEDKVLTYVLQYGVLLKPDTLGKSIFPTGTYVASSFTRESNVKRGEYEVTYFSSYEKLCAFIIKELESSKDFYDWVNGCSPGDIVIRL